MRRRAFSLVEALLTFVVILLVLGVTLDLLNQYASVLNFNTSKDNFLSVAQITLQQMGDELRESTALESPLAAAGPAIDLRFRRVDPNSGWLPPMSNYPPASWNAYTPGNQLEVRFELIGEQLMREVSSPTLAAPATSIPPAQTAVLANGIAGFQTQVLPSGLVDISLSVRERGVQWVTLDIQVGRLCP